MGGHRLGTLALRIKGSVEIIAGQRRGHMGVDPKGDGWVRVSETVGDHMHGHAGQQEVRGMNVPGS